MCPSTRSDHPAHRRVVVVGAGHAGVQVAETLRQAGHTGSLTLVGDEPVLPYQRPPLSKDYLSAASAEPLPLRGAAFFEKQQINLCTGVMATALDRRARTVLLADGRELAYDALVLACGARTRTLDAPGADLLGIHGLRTLAEAEGLRSAMDGCRSAVVVGAGFIGLEFAAAARERSIGVTVLEAARRPLRRAVSEEMALFLGEAHRRTGVVLRLGEGVTRFVGESGRVCGVISTSGRHYATDVVLSGIGVVPRVELAVEAGLEVENGIIVDKHLRTSDPDVYAVGDCANHPDKFTGTRVRLESVQNATDQARHVAGAILGLHSTATVAAGYTELPWFWSHQGDLKLQIAGLRQPDDHAHLLGDPAAGRFSVCCYRGNRLVAVESLNRPADHMAARRLLAGGRSPRPEQLGEPDFALKTFARTLAPAS